jgi:hypothetical protein
MISMDKKINLVLVVHSDMDPGDFVTIREHLRRSTPEVRTWIISDRRHYLLLPLLALRPTLAVSFVRLKRFRLLRGRVMTGKWLRKSEEYEALEARGVPVPRWRLVTADRKPDLSAFPPYVVQKPDGGGRGAEVKIKHKDKVSYRPWRTEVGVQSDALIAQEFVYTGTLPVSYRVLTLFGKALHVVRKQSEQDHCQLPEPDENNEITKWSGKGASIVSTGRGKSSNHLVADEREIAAFGEFAHSAFPDIPLLGVDIIRDARTGKLFVLEVNASGWVWSYSSARGLAPIGTAGYSQEVYEHDMRKAACILGARLGELAR